MRLTFFIIKGQRGHKQEYNACILLITVRLQKKIKHAHEKIERKRSPKRIIEIDQNLQVPKRWRKEYLPLMASILCVFRPFTPLEVFNSSTRNTKSKTLFNRNAAGCFAISALDSAFLSLDGLTRTSLKMSSLSIINGTFR